jgi:hypothetical protein
MSSTIFDEEVYEILEDQLSITDLDISLTRFNKKIFGTILYNRKIKNMNISYLLNKSGAKERYFLEEDIMKLFISSVSKNRKIRNLYCYGISKKIKKRIV